MSVVFAIYDSSLMRLPRSPALPPCIPTHYRWALTYVLTLDHESSSQPQVGAHVEVLQPHGLAFKFDRLPSALLKATTPHDVAQSEIPSFHKKYILATADSHLARTLDRSRAEDRRHAASP